MTQQVTEAIMQACCWPSVAAVNVAVDGCLSVLINFKHVDVLQCKTLQ